MFLGKAFQPYLMFVGREGLLESCLTWASSGFTRKNYTLERLAMEKHSILLRTFLNYGIKEFYNVGPGVPVELPFWIHQFPLEH